VWGAAKGAIGGLSPKAKVLIVLALALGVLLAPVVLVVVLLALLVFAVVAAVRTSASTRRLRRPARPNTTFAIRTGAVLRQVCG
jgi:hypothetical protein